MSDISMPILGYWQQVYILWGAISPGILAIIQQPKWNNLKRVGAGLLFHGFGAAIMVGVAGNFDFQHFGSTFSMITGGALLSYLGIWKPTFAAKLEWFSTKQLFGDGALPCAEVLGNVEACQLGAIRAGINTDSETLKAAQEACATEDD